MQPTHWEPPIELSPSEQAIIKRIKRAKLFVFLREVWHELFDEDLQNELNQMYQDSPVGQPQRQAGLVPVNCERHLIQVPYGEPDESKIPITSWDTL
ncbi:hypothetical protein K9N68_21065 [Kovacikia minuta CCNUW1]|uniref:hypothetical protein n=1 Tax=Kovacikia minuta TaxID=2931930 RepID=UPI001CCE4793|nr:hypothetical protein [Kovacikia minuta]UBF24197.1 hypothetical protein K9N68_21065 [Kovacikia minuta CCNUW1]